jgi:hypothetical protein
MLAARLWILIRYRDDMQYQIVYIFPCSFLSKSSRHVNLPFLPKLEFEYAWRSCLRFSYFHWPWVPLEFRLLLITDFIQPNMDIRTNRSHSLPFSLTKDFIFKIYCHNLPSWSELKQFNECFHCHSMHLFLSPYMRFYIFGRSCYN